MSRRNESLGRDDWPVPHPPGWRPPGFNEQAGLIVGSIVAVTFVVDALIALSLLYRPWGDVSGWIQQMLLCAAIPLNLTALGFGAWWLIRRRSKKEHRR